MASRHSLWACICLCAALLVVHPPRASAAPNAVEVHEGSGIPSKVTAWCLGNPREFAVAAEALGINSNLTKQDKKDNFISPSGVDGVLTKWAASTKEEDVATFDSACRLAYAAFSRSEVRPEESEDIIDSQAFGAAFGALIALGGAAGGGIWAQRRRGHEADAKELTALNDELLTAMQRYTREPYDPADGVEAGVKARALRLLLGEWRKYEGRDHNVTSALDRLEIILGENPNKPLPKIGALGNSAKERTTNGQKLMADTEKIHSSVVKVAKRLESILRHGDREPE